jgi:tRNA pseudouridine38-40 synthase
MNKRQPYGGKGEKRSSAPFRKREFEKRESRPARSSGGRIRFKLYIEYEGTRYSGWQIQQNAKSVQGKILEAAEKVFNTRDIELKGSGRTDSGVHALCQVAHLETATMLAPEIIRMKLNDELPADINILEVEKTSSQFHARHDAVSRSYIYQISKRRSSFAKPFVWWIKDRLDVEKMKSAAVRLVGMHDFASFSDKDDEEKSTKVLLNDISISEEGDLIIIKITASHFLWKMVRRIVGVLAEIGRGSLNANDIDRFLTKYTNEPAKFTAPPSGLFLAKVCYSEKELNDDFNPFISVNSYRSKK